MVENKIDKLNVIFRDFFDRPNLLITPETTADDIEGWDSLTHIDLMMALEEEFGVRLPTKIIMNANNVGELIEYL